MLDTLVEQSKVHIHSTHRVEYREKSCMQASIWDYECICCTSRACARFGTFFSGERHDPEAITAKKDRVKGVACLRTYLTIVEVTDGRHGCSIHQLCRIMCLHHCLRLGDRCNREKVGYDKFVLERAY